MRRPLSPVRGNVGRGQTGAAPGDSGLTVLRRAPCASNVSRAAAATDPRCSKALCLGAWPGWSVQPATEDAGDMRCGGEGLRVFEQPPLGAVCGPPT
eukprot:1658245-Alexandrium_andersonii.AAC.1